MPLKTDWVTYGGWENCLQMSNGLIELIIPSQVGLRVMVARRVGGKNIFAEFPDQMGKTGGDTWRIYGGHRLWHAPETRERTYTNDNHPIDIVLSENHVVLTQAVDHAGIQKQMTLTMSDTVPSVTITHRLTNKNAWEVTLSAWALSVLKAGGTAILPLPPRGSHENNLLPNSILNLWAYTNMADERFTWGKTCVLVRQENNTAPQKIGMNAPLGWSAYANDGVLLVKHTTPQAGAIYPDNNSAVEVFTNEMMLELETLSPLTLLAPNASVSHIEQWTLLDSVPTPRTESDVLTHILPLIDAL